MIALVKIKGECIRVIESFEFFPSRVARCMTLDDFEIMVNQLITNIAGHLKDQYVCYSLTFWERFST
jgi:hypothetical protein